MQDYVIGKSSNFNSIFDIVKRVSQTDSNLLLTGESGTGKSLIARYIHALSKRKDGPLITINCGAIPFDLIEAELFGCEKGAFTGANARRTGKFEFANGGTIFLDEISTIPMHAQVKFLRVIQEKTFERVGGNESIRSDVRIIAATNGNLQEEVKKGAFREDLFYRLNVISIRLPSLRERKEDLPALVKYFLHKYGTYYKNSVPVISEDALKALGEYDWPGNVRELENIIESLVVTTDTPVITERELPAYFKKKIQSNNTGNSQSLKALLRGFEKEMIHNTLLRTDWNRLEAARILKIHRNTLANKIRDLGISETADGNSEKTFKNSH